MIGKRGDERGVQWGWRDGDGDGRRRTNVEEEGCAITVYSRRPGKLR